MGKYLKMAECFDMPISVTESNGGRYAMVQNSGCVIDAKFSCDAEIECVSHAINSHDELVAEVERLRESLKWAVGNLPFENAFEWSDDENADSHYAALRLLGIKVEE